MLPAHHASRQGIGYPVTPKYLGLYRNKTFFIDFRNCKALPANTPSARR